MQAPKFFKFRKRIHSASIVVLDDVNYEESEDPKDKGTRSFIDISHTRDTIFSDSQNAPGLTEDDNIDTHVVTEMSGTKHNQNADDKVVLYAVSGIAGVSVFLLILVGVGFFLHKYVVSRN